MNRWRWVTPEGMAVLFLGVISAGALLGAGRPAGREAQASSPGEELFLREGCVFCHSLPGRTPVPQRVKPGMAYLQHLATTWSRNGPDPALEPGRRTDDWHLAHLVDPRAVLPGCPMPPYAALSEQDLTTLVEFLQTPGSDPTPAARREPVLPPAVPPGRASYLAARDLYRTYCRGCHGLQGNGAGSVGPLLSPQPRDFTDAPWMRKHDQAYLFDVTLRGKPGTAMPGYEEVLTREEVAMVVAYIRLFINPSARQRLEQGFAPLEN
jgi:mono/diheme cytochrome c family protein